ncbi:MAG: Cof-type HAD-IIB family hydrolase [Propionicimonas sp.]|uniref:Cof-type HAD-IIB family hydrolase n=1 Tax=Propionicimonas sp. TaxID=1955623 RepID=UPI002B206895|nr:Cof-type HAD-IIB family hydrolase [Propionicimonas sp.]MEA4945343.1 Cof-type HAD-IIB family hydrolase [Propionicimonas sp.]MEA5117796.1 Cof-type HAD-IIB family hydrolase [Propionicimonas sp.]
MTAVVPTSAIKLIATDLDGTLLRPDKTISPRTVDAIGRAHAAGIQVVVATGRYPTSLPILLAPTGIDYAVASNGAIGLRLSTGEILFEDLMPPQTAAEIVGFLSTTFPEARFEVVREHGTVHVVEPGYFDLVTDYEHAHFPLNYLRRSRAEVIAEPLLKMAVRHPWVSEETMLEALLTSGLTGFHACTSGAPFLEIEGPGVTKASGVAQLCEHLGLLPENVMAVGDAGNDIEMLAWAGIGVAMANAVPAALEAADHTTATNDQDGVAHLIERLLAA